jgi:hypothetical protein
MNTKTRRTGISITQGNRGNMKVDVSIEEARRPRDKVPTSQASNSKEFVAGAEPPR